jgi:hypothetical protein
MQNEESSDDSNPPSTTRPRRPWYKSQALAATIFILVFFSWILSIPLLDALDSPTLVILRSEGCAYLHYRNISTNSYPAEGACTVEVQFFPELIGSGGVMKIDGRRLDISENQIIAKEPIEDRPYTSQQKRLLAWMAFHTFIMFSTLFWLGSTFA